MVRVKCQHSGIEFEAKTRQTKQHPHISKLKSDSAIKGDYRQLNLALANVFKAGGYETIEEYMALVLADLRIQDAIYQERAKQELERYTAHLQIVEEQNRVLKTNGYIWKFKIVDYQSNRKEFYLTAPDGRAISVKQALEEIESKEKEK